LPAFEMLHLIAPVQYAATKCGSYIANSNRQPDVEVLAVALDDIPHSAEEFDKKRGGRDFYICKFLIVAVGPAGFGKVPYTHKKKGKKGDEEICHGLYENVVDGVKLYAYEKGDTNKDKGPRVDDCFGVLCPGLCLTFFLREEMFQASKIIADKPIDKTQFVCLQLGSSNVGSDSSKGAAGGWLVKLKKIKSIAPPDDVMQAMTKMPATEEAYDLLMSQHRSTHTTMKGVLSDKVDIKYCAVSSMGRDVFAVYEDEDKSFVICNAAISNKEGFNDDIVVPKDLVLACFDTLCADTALRVLNIALSMDAVRLLLQTAPETSIALNEDKPPPPNTALHLLCDYNKLLCFDALKDDAIVAWVQDKLRSFSQAPAQDMADSKVIGNMHLEIARPHDIPFSTLTYTSTDYVYKDHAGILNHIYVRVHEFVDYYSEACSSSESAPKFLAHEKSGSFNRVEILLRQHNTTGPLKPVACLQMRRGAMSAVGSKRKRPNILIDIPEPEL